MKSSLHLTIALSLLSFYPSWADEKRSFNEAYLIRHPGYLARCVSKNDLAAIIVGIPADVKRGDEFSVLTHAGNIVKGIFDKEVDLKTCDAMVSSEYKMGVLTLEKPLDWYGNQYTLVEEDALLAVKDNLNRQQAGSVWRRTQADTNLDTEIKVRIPRNRKILDKKIFRIKSPAHSTAYLLAAISFADMEEYKTAGDKALESVSFIWDDSQGTPRFLEKVDYVNRIFTVSDLDQNGSPEWLLTAGDYGGGDYKLCEFDGKKLETNCTVLYTWDH